MNADMRYLKYHFLQFLLPCTRSVILFVSFETIVLREEAQLDK